MTWSQFTTNYLTKPNQTAMKTLKILIALCFVLGLTSNNSNSQPVKEVFENYYVVAL